MPKFRELVINDVNKETEDAVSLAFDVPEELKEEFSFKPGQYLTLRSVINGEDLRRSYSICSSPLENELRVAIKKIEGGKFSTYSNDQLKPGDTLSVMKPMGRFVAEIDPNHNKHYLLFAAGSGITPILSIAKSVLSMEPSSFVTLVYGNQSFDKIIFREEIEGLKNSYIDRFRINHVLSRENIGNPLNQGRIDGEKCDLLFQSVLNIENVDDVFLCGPAEMISTVSDWLKSNGIKEESIHFELFTSPAQINQQKSSEIKKEENKPVEGAPEDGISRVQVIIDGGSISFDMSTNSNESILDTAIKNGADLPFSCKGGVCCTCKAKVIDGHAEMKLNYALEPHEVDSGFILSCQSLPKTKNITVDFDQI